MSEYAVVWADSCLPQSRFRGALAIASGAAHLRGTDGERSVDHDLSGKGTIVCRASRDERIVGHPSLCICLPNGRSFVVASLLGTGVILEIIDALAALV